MKSYQRHLQQLPIYLIFLLVGTVMLLFTWLCYHFANLLRLQPRNHGEWRPHRDDENPSYNFRSM